MPGHRLGVRLDQRGATLAMMALLIFLFFGLAALTIDFGMIKSAKAEAQRAADASALAAASALVDASLQTDAERSLEAIRRGKENVAQQLIRHDPADSTSPNFEVYPDPPNDTVGTVVTKPGIGLWFARTFGIGTMGVVAHAVAKVDSANIATCLMPVALPDIWNNSATANRVVGSGPNARPEDANGDGIWNWEDLNSNGALDAGEWEPWSYDQGLGDSYATGGGYGTDARNGLGSGPANAKTDDYGRQIVVQPLSPKDGAIAGYYQAWGRNPTDANSADSLKAHILNGLCVQTSLDDYYASNGGSLGGVDTAWNARINSEPSADWTWDDVNNEPVCPGGCPSNWLDVSPRVVTVALYDPAELLTPSDNGLKFNNFARIFLDQHCPDGTPAGQCKQPVTARFLGYVTGLGSGGGSNGTLVKTLRLIK